MDIHTEAMAMGIHMELIGKKFLEQPLNFHIDYSVEIQDFFYHWIVREINFGTNWKAKIAIFTVLETLIFRVT